MQKVKEDLWSGSGGVKIEGWLGQSDDVLTLNARIGSKGRPCRALHTTCSVTNQPIKISKKKEERNTKFGIPKHYTKYDI